MPTHPQDRPTDHQLNILRFIIGCVEELGFQPNLVETAEHFGVTPPAIRQSLIELEKRGFVELTPQAERAVRIKRVKFKAVFTEGS